jgi:hypothetical protein
MIELAASTSAVWTLLPEILFYEPEGRRGAEGGKRGPPAKSSANTSPLLESSDYGTSSAFRTLQGEEIQLVVQRPNAVQLQIAERLRELGFVAHAEGIRPSVDSLRDMQAFLASTPLKSRPSIYLQDSGNYRIAWRNPLKEQVAVQFLGNDSAQFVIFKLAPTGRMNRVAGVYSLNAIYRQIEANRAESLLA